MPLTINGRRRCASLKSALPRPRAADPRRLAAAAALKLDLGPVRDRRGRAAVSARDLLGAKGVGTAEKAITLGLATVDRLQSQSALSSISPIASASALATASARGCAEQAGRPERSGEFKGQGFDAKVDVSKGAAEIGVDLGGDGVRAEIDFGICDAGEEKFKAPDCPDVDGTLEASDKSDYFINLRILKKGELLLSQNLEFSSETAIKPIQVDDDAKIEYFEIEHTYRTGIEVGGSTQEFGKVSLKLTYHGSTRVVYPGAAYDPTHTDVEVKFDVAGADPHELREIEFDQGLAAKREADKNFAAEVDKAIARLAEKEKGWNFPNRCAEVKFEPASDTLTLEDGASGGFKARLESRSGGSPSGAKWTLLERQNATISPASARANPASFSYTVTRAGKGIEVQAAFQAVSQAGVAAGTWTQPTKEPPPPPPPPADLFKGSISGTSVYDGDELGAGNGLSAQWSGDLQLKKEPPLEQPGVPVSAYMYKLTAGSIVYSFKGTINQCHVAGSGPIDLGAQPDLNSGVSLILFEETPRTYQLTMPSPLLVTVPGTTSECDDPEDDGDDFDWPPAAGVATLAYGPKGDSVDQDWAFAGAGSGNFGPGSPDETWQWSFAPVP